MSEAKLDSADLLAAAGRMIADAALDLIQKDPHQWSTRPCQTCSAVSALVRRPFGCEKFRIEKGTK
jgi:hypothetical protein